MIPTLALVRAPRPRWAPAIPIPLFLAWPFLVACVAIATVIGNKRPTESATLRVAFQVFCQLRGLTVDIDPAAGTNVRIRFI